jgi:hypothetical protein
MPTLRLELQDDWCKAFVDGKFIAENHTIDTSDFEFEQIAKALGITLEKVEVEDD